MGDSHISLEETELSQSAGNNRRLARSTLIVMTAFAIAKLISLVQTFIIANVFGVGGEWDAFVTANRIPELVFTLISGGALAYAFIPVFSDYLAKGDRERAWQIASHVVNTIFTVTFFVSAIVFVIAPWLVSNVVAPGFSAVNTAQTVELMRILLVSTLIFSISGITMGILQSHNHFLLPALAPIMFDVGILIGVGFLLPIFGVNGIAIGAVLGAAMHFGIQVPGLIYYKAKWTARLGLNDPDLRLVIRLMIPRVLGLGVFSLNFIIMNNIASRLGEGSIAALDWGWRLMQIPQTLLGTAMGVVIFPTLAALAGLGNLSGKRNAMSGSLRFILMTTIPAAFGLLAIGRPLIGLLERGAFDSSASELVYTTLSAFTLGLVVHSMLEIVARSFYADKDTLTPLWAALMGAALNLFLSFQLSHVAEVESHFYYNTIAKQFPMLGISAYTGDVAGLALANSLGVAVEVGVLIVILRKRWHGIAENEIATTALKTLLASIIMAVAVVGFNFVWESAGLARGDFKLNVLQVILGALIGLTVFTIGAFALRMQEVNELKQIIRRK